MKLLEYQGKRLFAQYGISTPEGFLSTEGKQYTLLGDKVIVKAQVHTGGRGKAGGIKACPAAEAERVISHMQGSEIKGIPVEAVLVEERLDIRAEMYLSFSIDRNAKSITLLFTEEGGVDIETLAAESPSKVIRTAITGEEDIPDTLPPGVLDISKNLLKLMKEKDCELVEINPLVKTGKGLIAADSKVIIDDNAIFRHPELVELAGSTGQKQGFNFVKLDGDIGIIGNGAGLVMATLDVVNHLGGRPANFLDVGGGADRELMESSMKKVLSQDIKGIFINIFGGITRCDEIAEGIISYAKKKSITLPLAVRLVGTMSAEGKKLLETAGMITDDSMESCVKKLMSEVISP